MAESTYRISFTPRPGSLGTQVDYRVQNGSWITPSSPPNPTTLGYYDLSLTKGQTYNIRLSSTGIKCAPKYQYITIAVPLDSNCCAAGYTLSPDGTYCYKEETVPPTTVQSDICFAASKLVTQYSSSGTYLYNTGYTTTLSGTSTLLTTQPQWKEQTGQAVGPMNRDGVWVDANCDGTQDALTTGYRLNMTAVIHLTTPKTLYIGMGGDNTFRAELNGVVVVDRNNTGDSDNFNFFHVFPVDFPAGTNYVNFSGVGDGSTQDSLAAVIYDNTASEITSATSDAQLNRLFHSGSLVGGRLDIATCPDGYFLDTSGGQGSYVCKRVLTDSPFSC